MKIVQRFLPLIILSWAVSCGEKEGPDNGKDSGSGSVPEGNVEITIKADRTSYYPNPLSGWVIYVPLIDDVEEFWEKYENFPSSEGTVNVFDYGNVIYLRGSWTDFNPEENVYIWQDGIDEGKYPLARSLRLFEEGAKERGLKLAFTLKTDSRDANANCPTAGMPMRTVLLNSSVTRWMQLMVWMRAANCLRTMSIPPARVTSLSPLVQIPRDHIGPRTPMILFSSRSTRSSSMPWRLNMTIPR